MIDTSFLLRDYEYPEKKVAKQIQLSMERAIEKTLTPTPHFKKYMTPEEANKILTNLHPILESSINITKEYGDWVKTAYIFANDFGEDGRQYFHTLSKKDNRYVTSECDDLYNHALKGGRGEVHWRSLFPIAQKYEIPVTYNSDVPKRLQPTINLMQNPLLQRSRLPQRFQKIYDIGTNNVERATFLTSSLNVIAGALPHVYGIDARNKKNYPLLYVLFPASPASGKSDIGIPRYLLFPIQNKKDEERKKVNAEIKKERKEYNRNKRNNADLPYPPDPKRYAILLPPNITAAALYDYFTDNDYLVCIATEALTFIDQKKKGWDDYVTELCSIFHNEPIEKDRDKDLDKKGNKEPKLSLNLACTLSEVHRVLGDINTGLYSRFLICELPDMPYMAVPQLDKTPEERFMELAPEVEDLYNILSNHEPIKYVFTKEQKDRWDDHFEALEFKYGDELPAEFKSVVRRMANIAFRVLMIFSIHRCHEKNDFTNPTFSEEDFQFALDFADYNLENSANFFLRYTSGEKMKGTVKTTTYDILYAVLPDTFKCADANVIGANIDFNQKKVENCLAALRAKGRLILDSEGIYHKVK